MARRSGVFRRILELVLDRASAARTARQAQEALNKGTDPRVARRNLRSVQSGFSTLGAEARRLAGIFASVFAIRRLVEYADSWRLIRGRLDLVTDSVTELSEVQADLFEIAQRTRTSYEATATLFQRVALNARQLGVSQEDLLALVETVQKSIQLSGAGAAEASAGVTQLSQALAKGTLDGDEFRSVMENMPALAKTIADGLGVPIGTLREMSRQGQLTANQVIDAILRMRDRVDRDFRNVPVTIGQAFVVLNNEIRRFVGEADEVSGATSQIAQAILAVAAAIPHVGRVVNSFLGGIRLLGADAAVALAQVNYWLHQIARIDPIVQLRDLFTPGNQSARQLEEARVNLERMRAAAEEVKLEMFQLRDSTGEAVDYTEALRAAMDGASSAAAATAAELQREEDRRIDLLLEAIRLEVATAAEKREIRDRAVEINLALAAGNLALADRVRLTRQLADINATIPPAPDLSVLDQPIPRREPIARVDAIAAPPAVPLVPSEEVMQGQVDRWLAANDALVGASERAAFGIAGAFQDAFEALIIEGEGLAGMFEALFRGSAGAVFGWLADIAAAKVAENVAIAFEETAKGLAAGASLNPALMATAPGHFAAAKTAALAAAKWALVGGGTAAIQTGVSGGGRGGLSGGLPTGARDPAGRLADGIERSGPDIIIQVSGVDPGNPRHQELIGKTARQYQERYGGRITVQGVA